YCFRYLAKTAGKETKNFWNSEKLQTQILVNCQDRIGFVECVEMQPRYAEFDQLVALPGCILDAQLNRGILIVLDFDQLSLQFSRDLRTTERGETAHLWR